MKQKPSRPISETQTAAFVQARWYFCYYRALSLMMRVAVAHDAITCSIGEWTPVVHCERTVCITRFGLVPFGGRRALTFVDERGNVVYVHNLLGQHKHLMPALEEAGFVVSATEVSRFYPGVRRLRPTP